MDVIFPSPRVGSNVKELSICVSAVDIRKSGPLSPRFFNGGETHAASLETPAKIELLGCEQPGFLRQFQLKQDLFN